MIIFEYEFTKVTHKECSPRYHEEIIGKISSNCSSLALSDRVIGTMVNTFHAGTGP